MPTLETAHIPETTHTPPAGMKDISLRQGQAREFTMIFPLKPGGAQRMRERMKNFTSEQGRLMDKVGTLHDLRHAIFDNDTRLLFCTTFDGGFEQYINDFAIIVPDHIDAEFADCEGYPGVASPEIWAYIAKHQVPCLAFYSAYPDAPVRTVWSALRVKKAFDELLDQAQE